MATEPEPQSPKSSQPPAPGHETSDLGAKWVFAVIFGLLLCVVFLEFILGGLFRSLEKEALPIDRWQPVAAATRPSNLPPPPRLQTSPAEDLKLFRAHEEEELNSYGWINKTAGVVRIPIEEAMNLVLQQGLPVRSATNQNKLGPSSLQLMQQRPTNGVPQPPAKK